MCQKCKASSAAAVAVATSLGLGCGHYLHLIDMPSLAAANGMQTACLVCNLYSYVLSSELTLGNTPEWM